MHIVYVQNSHKNMEFKFIYLQYLFYIQCLCHVNEVDITSWDIISKCGYKIGEHVKAGELELFYDQKYKYLPCTVTVRPRMTFLEYNRNIVLVYFTKFDLAACGTEHVNLFDGLGSVHGAPSGEDDAVPLNTRPLCGTNATLLKDDQYFKAVSGAFQIEFQRMEPSMFTSRLLLTFVSVHEVNQEICSNVTGYHQCKSNNYCVPSEYMCSKEHKLCDQQYLCDDKIQDGDGNGNGTDTENTLGKTIIIVAIVAGMLIVLVFSLVCCYKYCSSGVKRDVKNCCTTFGRCICQPFRICGLSFEPVQPEETTNNIPTAGSSNVSSQSQANRYVRNQQQTLQNTHYQAQYSRDGTTDLEMVMFVDGLPPATPVFPPSYNEATSSLNGRAVPSISANVSPQLPTYSETLTIPYSQESHWVRSNIFPQLAPSSTSTSQRISNNEHTSQISMSLSTTMHPDTDVAPPSYEESISQPDEDPAPPYES